MFSSLPPFLLEPALKVQNLISNINRTDNWEYKHHIVTLRQLCRCHSNVGLQEKRSGSKCPTGQKLSTFWKSDPVEIEKN